MLLQMWELTTLLETRIRWWSFTFVCESARVITFTFSSLCFFIHPPSALLLHIFPPSTLPQNPNLTLYLPHPYPKSFQTTSYSPSLRLSPHSPTLHLPHLAQPYPYPISPNLTPHPQPYLISPSLTLIPFHPTLPHISQLYPIPPPPQTLPHIAHIPQSLIFPPNLPNLTLIPQPPNLSLPNFPQSLSLPYISPT